MILKRKLFSLIFSCLTVCTLNNCMEVNSVGSSGMLEIETSDGCKHTVAKELCLHSEVIRNILADLKDYNQIPLPEVSSHTLEMLVPLLQLIHEKRQEELSSELNLKSLKDLSELLKASNYLDIPQLLEAVSTCIADKLSTSEARQQFCTKEDFLNNNRLTELPRELSVLLGSKLAKNWDDLRIYLLNNCVVSNKILKGHTSGVYSAGFNNSGDKVVSASFDGTIRIWDVESGECLKVLRGHTSWVRSARFNNLGYKVVSASDDGTIRIWDVESGECLKVLEGHTSWVYSEEFNNSGDKVVSASNDGTVRIWDISELNAIDRYLQRDVTLEQALFLNCVCGAKQNNQLLDCRNCPRLLECYGLLPDCIQRILRETNAVVVPSSLRRLVGDATEFVNQHRTSMITGASAVGLASWLLMKGLSRK